MPLKELDELSQHRCITLRMLGGIRNTWSGYNAQGELVQVKINGASVCDNILPAIELAKQAWASSTPRIIPWPPSWMPAHCSLAWRASAASICRPT